MLTFKTTINWRIRLSAEHFYKCNYHDVAWPAPF